MNYNNLNSSKVNGLNTHIKSLKENLHFEFIKYVDYFNIFWLILNKKLRIHNLKSYNHLINKLNAVSNHKINDNILKNKQYYTEYITNSTWSNVIDRFIFNISNRFNIKDREFKQLDTLSQNDFDNCSIALGREPFGLYSVLKTCVCKLKQNKLNVDNFKSEIENICKEWNFGKIYECHNCTYCNQNIPLVGVVSPFVLLKHEEDLYDKNKTTNNDHFSNQSNRKRQKLDDANNYNTNFKTNQQLYSGHEYPLQSYLGYHIDDMNGNTITIKNINNNKINTSNNNINTHNIKNHSNIKGSYWLSDLIFELVCMILDEQRRNTSDVREEISILVETIKDNIRYAVKHNGELIENNRETLEYNRDAVKMNGDNIVYSLFDYDILNKVINENKDLISKVTKLKPFPTLYWLIDKELITKVSKLEGKGVIKQIESFIDSKVEEYNNRYKNKDKEENKTNNNNKEQEEKDKERKPIREREKVKEQIKDKESVEENIIELLFKDNLYYMLRRYRYTNPILIELLYNIIINSNIFSKSEEPKEVKGEVEVKKGNEEGHVDEYIYLNKYINKSKISNKNIKKDVEYEEIFKTISILNTLRTHGISGNKDFLHIKCLHTHLAYEIAEGSVIGSIVSRLI